MSKYAKTIGEWYMEFKDKITYVRAKLNISQTKLGELLHVSLATIHRWESGKVQPTKKDIIIFEEFCKDNNLFIKGDKE